MKRSREQPGDADVVVNIGEPDAKATEVEIEGNLMTIKPLGGGSEVGRSCILLEFKGKTIMLDCGIHPAYTGQAGLPFLDMVDDLSEVDLLLVSHFHLDHAAALPYLLASTTFDDKVYMTHATKAIYKMLLSDFVRVSAEDQLFSPEELEQSMSKIEVVHYHQDVEHKGIKFTAYNAGHVLGAAMFMIEIDGVRVLYTGDYSREEDRHLMEAEVPPERPDVLIVESTYGVQVHEPRQQRENRFTSQVKNIVLRGGRCLMPVFALGRAQELLLILDEFWQQDPDLQHIPIYYASKLAQKAIGVFQTYLTFMNRHIREQIALNNPFQFKHIRSLNSASFKDSGPCVVLASPGMLQSGLSRQLFEAWCGDALNGIVLTGYAVENTLAKHLLQEPHDIEAQDGRRLQVSCSITYVSFSAHCDYLQTSEFIDELQPKHIVLVHGETNQMARLKQALERKYTQAQKALDKEGEGAIAWRPSTIATPKNIVPVELTFRIVRRGKALGSLAEAAPGAGHQVTGVLVRGGFDLKLLAEADLPQFTPLSTSVLTQTLAVPFPHNKFAALLQALMEVYGKVEHLDGSILVADCVQIRLAALGKKEEKEEKEVEAVPMDPRRRRQQQAAAKAAPKLVVEAVEVEWQSGDMSDLVADSCLALACQVNLSPAALLQADTVHHHQHQHQHPENIDNILHTVLVHKFGEDCVKRENDETGAITVYSGGETATVLKGDVSGSGKLANGVKSIVEQHFTKVNVHF